MFTQSVVATVFGWLGILGGVLTVFGHLQGVFALSDWGRWIASHWQLWMAALWSHSLGNVLMIAAGAVVIFVARPSVFTRHIWTLLFLVAVLVAVSELSKLGVSLEPPKA